MQDEADTIVRSEKKTEEPGFLVMLLNCWINRS